MALSLATAEIETVISVRRAVIEVEKEASMIPSVPLLLLAASVLAAVGAAFGMLVRRSAHGSVDEGYSFAAAMIGGLESWADGRRSGRRQRPPVALRLLRFALTSGRRPPARYPDPPRAETLELPVSEATPARRFAVHVGFRRRDKKADRPS